MSDLEELVVVDTTEELSDSNEVSADQSAINRFESNQLELDDAYFRTQSNEKSKTTGKDSRQKPAKNNLTYENNPFGILLKSKFKVRAEMEDIPGSADKKCHFSVEGNEINIKFPLRGSDHRVMKRNGARKVIDFIMSLDRVPARLAELMTVPKEEVAANPVAKSRSANYRIVQQGENNRAVLVKKREDSKQHFLKFREVCAELTQANLVPKIDLVTRRDFKNGIKAKVITRLPGLDTKFVSMENTNMLAKLDSVTKALNYAETHNMGSFGGATDTPLNEDTFQSQEQPHSYFQQTAMHHYESNPYSTDSAYWSDPPQNHISVHSRLAPRVSPPPLPLSYDEAPLVSYPTHSPTNTFQAPETYKYGSYSDSYFDTTPPEADYPYYPQSSAPPQPLYPGMGPLRYMRGARHAPYDWKRPARSRLRDRRGKIASRRGRQPSLF